MKHRTLIGRAGVRCADGHRARLDYYLLRSGGRFGLEVRMRRGQERCRACLPELSPTPREALRTTKSSAEQLGLLDPSVSDDQLLDAMIAHPVLVNRPLVCTPKGVRLCRPSEKVLDLLDRLPPGPFLKEDGQLLIDAEGRRVG